MRTVLLAVLGAAALTSLPAQADHRYHFYGPSIGFGFGYGPYGPYYSPWYGPSFGVGIHVGNRYPAQRVRTADSGEQRALKLYVYPAAGQTDSADVRGSLPMPRLGGRPIRARPDARRRQPR